MIDRIDLTGLRWNGTGAGSSAGMLSKDRIVINGHRYFVKMSSYNIAHGVYGMESVSEVLASRLAKILGVECVGNRLYDALVTMDGNTFRTLVCISKDYNIAHENILTFEDFYRLHRGNGENTIDFIRRCGVKKDIYKMFVFDYIINNLDRHGANVEVYENKRKIAPLFDNGLSLYATTGEDAIKRGYSYDNNMQVNNFIGERNLLQNLKYIDCPIKLNKLRKEDRAKLFKDMGKVLSLSRRNAIWALIVRRYQYVGEVCNIKI